MQIIDAHHHLWDLERHDYAWLKPATRHPAGDLTPICKSYRVEDFLADAAGVDLAKSVHLQAAMADPIQESAWLQALADDPAGRGFPHAIMAYADLADPGVDAVLERQRTYPNVRGIRFMVNFVDDDPLYCMTERGDWLRDAQWQRGYALLEKHGLSFDLQVYHHQMADAAALAGRHSGIQMLLNHAGLPVRRDPDYLEAWRKGMRTLAERPNIAAKISGLNMFHHDWTVGIFRPLVLETIEMFGVERCMFASNFPMDKLHAEYGQIWQAFDQITAHFSVTERDALFHDNAARFYRL